MKNQYWFGLLAAGAIAFAVGQTFAQDDEDEDEDESEEEVMEEEEVAEEVVEAVVNWRAVAKQHAELAKTVGDFNIAMEMFMAPDQPPGKSQATAKRELIMGGMYIQETVSATMGGQKFEGRMVLGYDTVRQQYTSSWIDNSSPVMSLAYGDMNGDTIVFSGEEPNAMSGKLGETKSTVKIAGPDSWVMTMYNVTDDGDQMTMRLTYTRKK